VNFAQASRFAFGLWCKPRVVKSGKSVPSYHSVAWKLWPKIFPTFFKFTPAVCAFGLKTQRQIRSTKSKQRLGGGLGCAEVFDNDAEAG